MQLCDTMLQLEGRGRFVQVILNYLDYNPNNSVIKIECSIKIKLFRL